MKTDLWTRVALWAGITVLAVLFPSACAVNDDPLKVGELRDGTPTSTAVSDSPASADDSTGATPEPQETAVRLSAAGAQVTEFLDRRALSARLDAELHSP